MNDLARQLHIRLRGLEAAGVNWLPKAIPLPIPQLMPPADPVNPPAKVDAADSIDQRRVELRLLSERVSQCTRCPELAATRTQTVFGVGPVAAEILFLGEAPGSDEDRQGEPFVGAAGQMLNRIITGSGLRREDIFICNILRCRPPGNRTPKPDEARNCREYLEATIALVQPKVIVCWGAVAAQNLLESTTSITRLRGKFYNYRDIPVLCTFHPAALLEGRSPEKKKEVWEDMQMLLKHLGLPIPATKRS